MDTIKLQCEFSEILLVFTLQSVVGHASYISSSTDTKISLLILCRIMKSMLRRCLSFQQIQRVNQFTSS